MASPSDEHAVILAKLEQIEAELARLARLLLDIQAAVQNAESKD